MRAMTRALGAVTTRDAAAASGRSRSGSRKAEEAASRTPPRLDGKILYLEKLTVSFDGFKALDGLTLYVDPGELQIGRHLHPRQRDESDTGVVNLPGEQHGNLLADFLTDAFRPCSLCHVRRAVPG